MLFKEKYKEPRKTCKATDDLGARIREVIIPNPDVKMGYYWETFFDRELGGFNG